MNDYLEKFCDDFLVCMMVVWDFFDLPSLFSPFTKNV